MIALEKIQTANDVFEKLFSQFTVELVSCRSNEILKDQKYMKTTGKIDILEAKLKELLSDEALKIYTEIEELQSYLCAIYELHGYRQRAKRWCKTYDKAFEQNEMTG
ncbi:hypothetical protein [Caldicellulosiruptor changbaiensis]|uniref:hypothetical protein n=1 Tax=Caldicellulosiruptor changbaiensis TaxID=1222016 RepID=UPI001F4A04DC|nr:hypothetical protein [Caldicellulosiruptor changbaiensis]